MVIKTHVLLYLVVSIGFRLMVPPDLGSMIFPLLNGTASLKS